MPMPMRRRVLAYGILALWVLVLAGHVRREYFQPDVLRLESGARLLSPGSHFYVIRMGGRAIGFASARLDTVPEGFLFDDVLTLDVPAMDTLHRAVVRTRIALSSALDLRSFSFSLESSIGRFEASGQVGADRMMDVEIGGDAGGQPTTLRLEEGQVLAATLPLRLAASGQLRVGRSHRVRLFDPSTLAGRDIEIRVTAHDTMIVPDTAAYDPASGLWATVHYDTLAVWRVEEVFGGVAITSWIDEDGRVVRAESPLGFIMERESFEVARQEWDRDRPTVLAESAGGYGAIIEATAIASNVDLDEPGALDRLRVRLGGVDLDGLDLTGGRQTLHGDTLVVEREDVTTLADAGYRLPWRGGGEAALELEATPLIQAGDARILQAAREAAGGTDDPALVARRLNDWVYRRLRKEITLSVPSALQVLQAGVGDCNEHTVLYVALARSLGLPARTAVGLVHVDGRFYYHAWPEVWLDDRWVGVDPTLGQYPADASHLRFLVGGLARQIELIRLLGRLRLEVL